MAGRFGLWARLARSPWSADAYRDVSSCGIGSMFCYLLILVAAATVIFTIHTFITMSDTLNLIKPWVRENIPEIHITDGRLSSPVDQPYVFEQDDFGFVLDTTGATQELDPKYAKGILLTESRFIYRESETKTREYDLSKIPDMVLDADTIDKWVQDAQS